MQTTIKQSRPSKPVSVAEYISQHIDLCGRSQIEIAQMVGFEKPNVITMIKQGKTKLPLERLGKFSKAIEVDSVYLYKLCMMEYFPDTWAAIEEVIGQPVLTKNELKIIETIRKAGVDNPKILPGQQEADFIRYINTNLKSDNSYES